MALFRQLEDVGLADPGLLLTAYDTRTTAAEHRLLQSCGIDEALQNKIQTLLDDAAQAAEKAWAAAADVDDQEGTPTNNTTPMDTNQSDDEDEQG
eukprot:8921942-Heterocapsa_arctica.AAC.1